MPERSIAGVDVDVGHIDWSVVEDSAEAADVGPVCPRCA